MAVRKIIKLIWLYKFTILMMICNRFRFYFLKIPVSWRRMANEDMHGSTWVFIAEALQMQCNIYWFLIWSMCNNNISLSQSKLILAPFGRTGRWPKVTHRQLRQGFTLSVNSTDDPYLQKWAALSRIDKKCPRTLKRKDFVNSAFVKLQNFYILSLSCSPSFEGELFVAGFPRTT